MSSRRGFALLTSTAFSFPFASAKSVLPSVFTMSGSSTPSSWTFVPEKSTPCFGGDASRALRGSVVDDARPPPEPVGPDEAGRLGLGVPKQIRTRAERDQAAGLGGGALARGLGSRAVGRRAERGGGENRQRRSKSDAFADAHHLIYTSQTPQPSPPEV